MCTTDGFQWRTILSAFALPGSPDSEYFDPVSDPSNRALYVVCEGRSVLRLDPIPRPEFTQPSGLDDMMLAAALDA